MTNYPDGMTQANHAYLDGQEHDTRCPLHPDQPGYICRERNTNSGRACGNILEESAIECSDCRASIHNSDGDWSPEEVVDDDCRCLELTEAAADRGQGL